MFLRGCEDRAETSPMRRRASENEFGRVKTNVGCVSANARDRKLILLREIVFYCSVKIPILPSADTPSVFKPSHTLSPHLLLCTLGKKKKKIQPTLSLGRPPQPQLRTSAILPAPPPSHAAPLLPNSAADRPFLLPKLRPEARRFQPLHPATLYGGAWASRTPPPAAACGPHAPPFRVAGWGSKFVRSHRLVVTCKTQNYHNHKFRRSGCTAARGRNFWHFFNLKF